MDLMFIGQGLDPESDITTGNYIIDSLNSNSYISFKAFVAFVSQRGLENIINQLMNFKEKGGSISLYVGVDLNSTSKEALEKLIEYEIETYIVYSPNNIIYHPKIYIFEGTESSRVIMGSSNLTVSGLFQNIEASTCIDLSNADEKDEAYLAEIYSHFNSIMNLDHQGCQKLNSEILELLVATKIILPEAVNRQKNNKISKEFGKKDLNKNSELLHKFNKLKRKRPPLGYKKAIIKEEIDVEFDEKGTIVYENIIPANGSMWVETGRMTGGSRNILDLSKAGKREEVKYPGSISFFDVDPNDKTVVKNIDLLLGGKIYKNNKIIFTEGNMNWRIQLKGETDDGEKLTAISRTGGFVDKILLFTKINDSSFKLEILDLDNKEELIDNSSYWAKGGSSGLGRVYGII